MKSKTGKANLKDGIDSQYGKKSAFWTVILLIVLFSCLVRWAL